MRAEWLARHPHQLGVAALGAGLALAVAPPPAGLVVAACSAAGLLAARLPRHALLVAALLLAGVLVGAARLAAIDRSAQAAGAAGSAVTGRATVLERPRPSRFGSSAVLSLPTGSRVLARADAGMRWPEGGDPGTIVRVRGLLRRPARGSGELDWPAHLRRRGIAFELELRELHATGARRGGLLGAIAAARRRGEGALATGLAPERAALARGMVLGQDERIDPLVREDFQRSGLAHVLAVSGQNVMLLCLLAVPLLYALRAGPRLRLLVPLGLIAAYVPLAGAGPSLQRAGVMGAAGLVALAASRPASRWYALGLAAVVTLAWNPRVAGDVGWQLSFAAVAGILLLARPAERALGALPRLLASGVAITLAATVATAPLMAHHFGTVSLAGLGANVVALPVVAPVMWVGMLQVTLAQLPGTGLPIALLGAIGDLLLRLLEGIVRTFADAPGAGVALPLRSPLAVAAAYGAIAAGCLGAARIGRRGEPRARAAAGAFRHLSGRARAATAAGLAAAVALAWTHATAPAAPPDRLTVRFLDVGQGDATLIQDGGGHAVLFDGGPPEARVHRALRDAGVGRLDLVVATHQSRDHHGGLHEVLERVPVGALLDGGDGTRDPGFRALLEEASERGVERIRPHPGQVLRVGRLRIEILGPPPRPPGPPPEDPNPRAIVAIVSSGGYALFLSGDAESDALLPLVLPDVDAMKVSHHGSADPGLPELLDRLRPEVAAIEVGEGNSYGHPAPETLAALEAAVPRVYRTDQDGTVSVTVRRGRIAVEREH